MPSRPLRDQMLIEAAKRFHAENVQPKLGAPVGASLAEVDALERTLGFSLPRAYREYLLWMGKDHHGIFRGSDWFIGSVFGNRDLLSDLLEEVGSDYRLKASDVVFFTHQGYMAAWFDAEGADPDPPCFFITDGSSAPRPTGLFSQALLDDIRGQAAAV